MGRTLLRLYKPALVKFISTHSPRVGRTKFRRCPRLLFYAFQLTRPVRGEPTARRDLSSPVGISTHSPRVGRTSLSEFRSGTWCNFNSLAPCGANPTSRAWGTVGFVFQLTRPVWGEPIKFPYFARYIVISSHSPRVGRTLLPV